MIYVLEGPSGSGKTTFTNTLKGFIFRKTMYRDLKGIREALEEVELEDIAYDRLFMNVWLDRSDEELRGLNVYFKSLKDVKFYKFMTDKETSFQARLARIKETGREIDEEKLRERINYEVDRYEHIFSIMDVFEEAPVGVTCGEDGCCF